MKKIIPVLICLFILAACTREDVRPRQPVNESTWLSRERGVVSYNGFACDYFMVETYNGYSVLRSWDGPPPLSGSVIYGDFSGYGLATYYDRSSGILRQADTREYWLSYWEARDLMDWNCSGQ